MEETEMAVQSASALVVEDDPSWQQILQEILTDLGLQVEVVASYRTAARRVRRRSHALAVVDLSLGEDHQNQDGIRVLGAIQKYHPQCVSILLTGFATVELAVEAIKKHGAQTCLRKEEFKRGEFIAIVNEALALDLGERVREEGGMEPVVRPEPVRERVAEVPVGRALVVEDDPSWRELLSGLLGEAGFEVADSPSYVEALGNLHRGKFQLAVIDLSLASSLSPEGNQDGYRLLESTSEADVPVVIVSGIAEPGRIEQAYKAGWIYACLEKSGFDRRKFKEIVREASLSRLKTSRLSALTNREIEVLTLLAQGHTNKEIAGLLVITKNTVKRHLKSVFSKLEVHNRSAAVAVALGEKLIS